MGLSLAALATLIKPERIFLAGPLAQARHFFGGFRAPVLSSLDGASGEPETMIQHSRISYLQAAR